MRSFFKMFFAALLALFVFCLIGILILVGVAGALSKMTKEKAVVANQSVLTINLEQHFAEQEEKNPLGILSGQRGAPGLYDAIRLIRRAGDDKKIKGIFIVANDNTNGFASSEELRQALADFKKSRKFILAHGDLISQSAYYVASVADRIYASPTGGVEWKGLGVQLAFLKGTLDRLNVQPQIFYAGKFKSATEPFRGTGMTPENKLQTTEWLGDIYHQLLGVASQARGIDTATLHQLANSGAIQQAADAVQHNLIDGLRYDDQVKDELKERLGLKKYDKLHLVDLAAYANEENRKESGDDGVALIYAAGNIIDGKGDNDNIASENYIKIIRKVRLDKSIKAIVLRINSPGGSALASENIWRELSLAKKEKPLVVSFGDVAASGGYYMGVAGDSIFALPNTITGSIGVFGIIPNMQGFFNDKLGVTFDGVKTGTFADGPSALRPMTEAEKAFTQQGIDRIYLQFKERVAQGRKKSMAAVDSMAQGRVWSGVDGLRLGLVDRLGGLTDAIACASRMAGLKTYRLREFPQSSGWLDELLDRSSGEPAALLKGELGIENYQIYKQLVEIRQLCGTPQARLPFQFFIR